MWARMPRPIDLRYAGGGSGFSASGERPAQEHLYDTVSPTAADGRGLAQGRFFDENGAHLASATQEGLLRQTPEPPPGFP
jgi:hypothetical protein